MHGPITTAGKIDAFESRFTTVNGAQFLIAGNGREAWPVSAVEAEAFKALYRRRMVRARWIRRGVFIVPFGLLLLSMAGLPVPETLVGIVLGLYLIGIPIAFAQHSLTGHLTLRGIERGLQHRITTRFPAAVTPAQTPLGRFGRRLLLASVVVEIAMVALHLFMDRHELARHMRVMYGRATGEEGLLAQVTGNLAWGAQYGLLFGVLLLWLDRRRRQQAARETQAAERAAQPTKFR